MSRFFLSMVLISWIAVGEPAKADNPIEIAGEGWVVSFQEAQHTLSISHETLGAVLTDVRLNLRSERGLNPLTNWSVEKTETDLSVVKHDPKHRTQISIRTAKPATAWLIELLPNTLKISSTSTDAVLTANAPSPSDRIVARLLDPQGVPVEWMGTAEIHSYEGGRETRNPSFLPSRNPEVMYFALGQVSSLNLHNVFDRKTDTAISFSDQTVMQRSRENAEMIELTIPVPGNTVIRLIPDYYTKTLGLPHYVPFDDSHFRTAPTVWHSWDNYYNDVTEADIVRNTDWIAAHLKPYGFEYIVVDDGYDYVLDPKNENAKKEHYWTEKWDQTKFPHGPKWLADYIKSKGLHPGVWIVPNSYAGAVEQHPDWYLRYKGAHRYWGEEQKDGSMVLDYDAPTLDDTNPEVLDFLKKEFTTLDELGFEYYMFDGEHDYLKYVPGVDLDRIHDKSIDPIVAYRNRLKVIRETIGPERFIDGAPTGTPLNGIGYFNSYFNGQDSYASWRGDYVMFSSINANAFLNHIVVYTMASEGIEVGLPMSVEEAMRKRSPEVINQGRDHDDHLVGFGASLPEARTLVTYTALTGVVYGLSSVTPELPEERVKLLQMSLPTLPILPIDLFSRGTDLLLWDLFNYTTEDTYIHNYPEILDLKVNAPSGVYDVVGMTNWRGETATRDLTFTDKLGLPAGASYIAFDSWNQKLAGVYKDGMWVTIEPHDTRVFLLYPLLGRPQLIGNSRHITGVYSILEQGWDGSTNTLYGTSQAVAGDSYILSFYVPRKIKMSEATAKSESGRAVALQIRQEGDLLRVSFEGQKDPVIWKVRFTE